jgi:thiopurine S-methyltransferase
VYKVTELRNEGDAMDSEFWLKKWEANDIRFHQTKFHPSLEKYGSRLGPGMILVPLCGKSLDMIYLSQIGHEVLGVELSPIACEDFFLENNLRFTKKSMGEFIVYESPGIALWCGDFFQLPKEIWTQISGIYDRAALIALPPEMRKKYAREILEKRSKPLEILLVSITYEEGKMAGPPFSVPEEEIRFLYSSFRLLKLDSAIEERSTSTGLLKVIESVYWLGNSSIV